MRKNRLAFLRSSVEIVYRMISVPTSLKASARYALTKGCRSAPLSPLPPEFKIAGHCGWTILMHSIGMDDAWHTRARSRTPTLAWISENQL